MLVSIKENKSEFTEYLYDTLLPTCIECGLTIPQAMDCTFEEIECYIRAYQNKIHREAHLIGYYNNVAFAVALNNAFASKKSDRVDYPNEPITSKLERTETYNKLSVEDKDKVFRNSTNEWI